MAGRLRRWGRDGEVLGSWFLVLRFSALRSTWKRRTKDQEPRTKNIPVVVPSSACGDGRTESLEFVSPAHPPRKHTANEVGITRALMLFLDRIIWILTAIILAGALSACSLLGLEGRVWYKPGGTIEERDRLLAAAELQATKAQTELSKDPEQSYARKQTERHTVLTFMTAAGWQLMRKSEAGQLGHATGTGTPQRRNVAPTALDR